jgi:alginate O-acetyltransferase complex protein AlgI
MEFNSLTYIVFFLIVYLIYRITPHGLQNATLLIASYLFYGWWDVRFLFLLVLSTAINYCCGLVIRTGAIGREQRILLSAWVILGYVVSFLINWDLLHAFLEVFGGHVDWADLTLWGKNWPTFFGVCLGILLLNLLYTKIASLSEKGKRGLFLFVGVCSNLLILGGFKYYNFFIDNVEWLVTGLGFDPARFHLEIILPVGISFYTFKGIGYLVDTYRGQFTKDPSYMDFAVFMAFFPALLAGPIDRARNLLSQISKDRSVRWDQSIRGLHLIFYGLFKKMVIADGVVGTVNSVFGSSGLPSWIDVVVATVLFTVQIYCDFSGYTDMARGTAKLFGIDLMVNFELPYFARNPREFWRRWHISLSTWLRDYLYIPLGGNRGGRCTPTGI